MAVEAKLFHILKRTEHAYNFNQQKRQTHPGIYSLDPQFDGFDCSAFDCHWTRPTPSSQALPVRRPASPRSKAESLTTRNRWRWSLFRSISIFGNEIKSLKITQSLSCSCSSKQSKTRFFDLRSLSTSAKCWMRSSPCVRITGVSLRFSSPKNHLHIARGEHRGSRRATLGSQLRIHSLLQQIGPNQKTDRTSVREWKSV